MFFLFSEILNVVLAVIISCFLSSEKTKPFSVVNFEKLLSLFKALKKSPESEIGSLSIYYFKRKPPADNRFLWALERCSYILPELIFFSILL